jgi:hypothetical protein
MPREELFCPENSMRVSSTVLLVAGLAAAGLAGCAKPPPPPPPQAALPPPPPTPVPPGQNAPVCVRTAEKQAFDVSVLKSQLMVTAVSCQSEDRYNAFVTHYQPTLASNEKVLASYFGRAYGKRAQSQQDDYVTQLANAQSQLGIKAGTLFCQQTMSLFDEVMALPSSDALPTYAAAKPLQQAMAVTECPPPAPPAPKKKP